MNMLQTKIMILAGLGAMAMLPHARADEWSQRTVLTFSAPVEVPGQTLPAGKYVFKLANSNTNRHIVQVFNADENKIFATFLAIPTHRRTPSDKTIIRFDERAAGEPQAIKAWFYPHRTDGHEFVYPKTEAVALAKANDVPVPATAVELPSITHSVVTLKASEMMAMLMVPLKMEEPTGEEVGVAEPAASSGQSAELPAELPKTASPIPMVGLFGLLSLGTSFMLRRLGARAK